MDNFIYQLVANDDELSDAFTVRKQVFVLEQGISEDEEYDGHDAEALHIIVKDGGSVVGTARVRYPAAGQAKIERMAVLVPYRRKGIGSGIISYLDTLLRKRQIEQVILHAQCTVTRFYQACGFEETGSPFREAGIEHVKMQKRL